MDMIADLDTSKLSEKQLDGLRRVMVGFDVKDGTKDAVGFRHSHGATHEFFDIVKHIDAGDIAGIQESRVVMRIGDKEITRRYDYVLTDGTLVDKKAWSVSNIKKYLAKSADGDFLIPSEETTGQLFRDFVAAGTGSKVRWSFDARAKGLPSGELRKLIESGLSKNLSNIASSAGLKDLSERSLREFKKKVIDNIEIEISDI